MNDDVDADPEYEERYDFEAAGLEKKEEPPKPNFSWYSWVVLAFVVFVRVMVQSQRAIFSFAYGYTGLGAQAGNIAYEISAAYPQLKQYFGLLTGLAYTLPFASFGLVVGGLTDTANRKIALSIVIACAAATMGLTGFCDSFLVLAAMRVVHGMVNSASNPFSFSLITDYFPPDKRATANSMIHSGQYIGSALSSISILLIQKFGWRNTYGLMGLFSAIISAGIFFFVKEPERGRFMTEEEKAQQAEEKRLKEEQKEKDRLAGKKPENPVVGIFKNILAVAKMPTSRNVLIAGFLRNFAGCIVTYYLPVFHGKNFPEFKVQYAAINALILSGCGLLASVSSGIMADVFEKKSLWAKAWILCVGQLLSVPLMMLTCWATGNFWLSIGAYALYHTVASTYAGPAITMMQNTAPPEQQGNVVSAYFFVITIG